MTDVGPTAVEREPSPARVATVLGLIFAMQVFAMLLIVAGGIFLMVTIAHNNSLSCSAGVFGGEPSSSCNHRSYVWPAVILGGGFGLFLVGIAVSALYAMRHVGAPLLGALTAKRRLLQAEANRPERVS